MVNAVIPSMQRHVLPQAPFVWEMLCLQSLRCKRFHLWLVVRLLCATQSAGECSLLFVNQRVVLEHQTVPRSGCLNRSQLRWGGSVWLGQRLRLLAGLLGQIYFQFMRLLDLKPTTCKLYSMKCQLGGAKWYLARIKSYGALLIGSIIMYHLYNCAQVGFNLFQISQKQGLEPE